MWPPGSSLADSKFFQGLWRNCFNLEFARASRRSIVHHFCSRVDLLCSWAPAFLCSFSSPSPGNTLRVVSVRAAWRPSLPLKHPLISLLFRQGATSLHYTYCHLSFSFTAVLPCYAHLQRIDKCLGR